MKKGCSTMIVDRIYKISAFGDFSDITPTAENMMFFLENFKEDGLIPTVFQEFKIDNGTPQPKAMQRIALISNDGLVNIPIGTARIDYEIKITEDVKLSPSELDKVKEKIVRILGLIFNHFCKSASRLALNTENLIVGLSDVEIASFLKLFSNPISSYNAGSLEEWSTRLMVRKDAIIGERKEKFNVITAVAKTNLHKNVNNEIEESVGFSISGDINTIAEKTALRFGAEDFEPFIDVVTSWWENIINELS